ncbi:hypothetical protein ALI22I_05310 [Saccharothrix sp. ALI-22-I]|nr:hypothetical protein ALI22I_05310 [Saccharothrix sp. ALI-22-I]
MNIGVIEDDRGRSAEAERWWRQAFDHGARLERTVAAFNLARVFEGRGEIREATRFYRIAVDSPEPEAARRARAALDDLG